MSLTYASYLHLEELLKLQVPRSEPPEHDEMIFIVVHQAYELWFKLQLHELEKIKQDFRAGHAVAFPNELRERDVTLPAVGNETVAEGILRLYKSQPDLEILFEMMTDFDEGFQEWRYRHIKLVERSIGSKRGTGGSLGVEFLKKSLFHPIFPDLWAIRHKL